MKKKIIFLLLSAKLQTIMRIVLWALSRNRGEFHSLLLREVFKKFQGVDIGLYTHGACFIPEAFPRNTKIGRYCSIARTALAFNVDHPLHFKSTHAFFFNSVFGYCEKDKIADIPLEIGHDVWLGSNVVILPTVKNIGTGAVVAAGAIVNKDIPPYAVVAGNPARIVRYRFAPDTIKKLLESKWWEMSIEEIKKERFDEFTQSYEDIA
jgi:acetyltransferase-like isoleucine patch superfamily enzyme